MLPPQTRFDRSDGQSKDSLGRAIQQTICFLLIDRTPHSASTQDCCRSDVPHVASRGPDRRILPGTGIDSEAEETMASPRCTRLVGGPRMPAPTAGGHSPARTGTGRIAQVVRRRAGLVFGRAGRTACVAAAGPGNHVVPRTGSAAEESSGYVGARGMRRVCLRLGRCGWAEHCALGRETGAARMRLALGMWQEARSHCRFLFGRHSCIQSFGSAKGWGIGQYIHGLNCALYPGSFDMQTYRGARLSPKHVCDRAHHGTCKAPRVMRRLRGLAAVVVLGLRRLVARGEEVRRELPDDLTTEATRCCR